MVLSGMVSCGLLLATPLHAYVNLPSFPDRSSALTNALREGKLVLMSAGTPGCPSCVSFDYGTLTQPDVNAVMNEGYVFWNCDMSAGCQDFMIYTHAAAGFPLPAICIIDPTTPANAIYTRYGQTVSQDIIGVLIGDLLGYTAPIITNITDTVVQGRVCTNTGIRSVVCQLNDNGWHTNPVTEGKWTFQISDLGPSLASGTNYLKLYHLNNASRHGKTNTVALNSGPLAPNLVIANYVDLQEVTTNRITLTGTASDAGLGDSGIKSVTVNGLPAANGIASGSATANWSIAVSLSTGTNTLRVIATDNAPAHNSTTNVIRIISDTVRPTCLITSPSQNQRCSNAVFMVKGTAKDNLQVTGVWCLTNGVWGYASPSNNNWANWSMDVALVPGLNTVRACAVDAAGNKSLTNTVTFNYVLSDRLTLASAGRGTLSPNYSNAMLEIGKTYTITAMPASGFAFSTWTGSLATNAVTLRFVMQSNLLFTANFIDVQKPTCAITAPAPSQRWSNAVFTVKGTAKDNWQVAGVWCLTNGVWGYASPSNNNWANWSVDVALVPGLNTVRACAVDAAGNKSLTNTVTFSYVLSDRLTLVTTGRGTLSPNYSNAMLEIGKTYKITAMPGPSYVFSNWTGTVLEYPVISSSTAALSFVMRSNLVLEADFVPNPFIAFKGSYNGLFYPTINTQPHPSNATSTGFFALMLATNGGFSGRVVLQGTNFPFSGAFNAQLQAQTQVARLGQPALALNLQFNQITQDGETNVLTGTVGSGADWLADLLAYRAISAGSNGYGGAYTMLVGGCEDDGACFGVLTNVPWGDSPLIVRVNPLTGALQMNGTLADGNNLTQTTSVSENGLWPFYVPLYAGRGFLTGWLSLDKPSALLYWLMPASANRFYTNGFCQPRRALLAKYIAPSVGQNAVTWTNAEVVLVGGKLPGSLTSRVVLEHNALRVTGGSISNLNLTINPSSGLFSGSFVHPVSKQVTPFRGLVEQVLPPPESVNGGWFLGPDASGGIIRLHPE